MLDLATLDCRAGAFRPLPPLSFVRRPARGNNSVAFVVLSKKRHFLLAVEEVFVFRRRLIRSGMQNERLVQFCFGIVSFSLV